MAILMLGNSESSCSVCSGYASPSEDGHYTKFGLTFDSNGKPQRGRVEACGEKWEGIRTTYYHPQGWWEGYVKNPSQYGFIYPHLIGLPCYKANGEFVGHYGEGLDVQLQMKYDDVMEANNE